MWSPQQPLPEPRKRHCMAQIDRNAVLVAGGFKDSPLSSLTKSTLILNLDTGEATNVGDLINERVDPACEVFNGTIYLVAGRETELYNIQTKEWRLGPRLDKQVGPHGSLIALGKSLFYADVEKMFKLENGNWVSIPEVTKKKKDYVPLGVITLETQSKNNMHCIFSNIS